MKSRAFTLIELLVVIAIIGILSTVVLASLDSARSKANVTSIKANLRDMIPQAELSYYDAAPNSYANACTVIANMLNAITSEGGTASCYSYDNTRWGVSVKLNSDNTQNWAVDSRGVGTWDTADASGGAIMYWSTANTTCAAENGRLPSVEELEALYLTYGTLAPSFASTWYWTTSAVPADNTLAYRIHMQNGAIASSAKVGSATYNVRCIR